MVNVYLFNTTVRGKKPTKQHLSVSIWWCSLVVMSQEPGAPGTTDWATGLRGKRLLLQLAGALPRGPQLAGFHLPAIWSLEALFERVTWARVLGNRSRSVLRLCMSQWTFPGSSARGCPCAQGSVNVEILIPQCRLGTGKKIEHFV